MASVPGVNHQDAVRALEKAGFQVIRQGKHMKMKQNTVIHILLGVAILPAIACLYLILARPGRPMLSPSGWIWFGSAALALILAAFGPSLLRRMRGLPPPQPLSPSDIRFSMVLVVVLCPLTFFAVWTCGPFGSLAIMLAPIALILRAQRNPGAGSSFRA